MILQSILLDASMTARETLARFARYGLWTNPEHPEARAWIEEYKRGRDAFLRRSEVGDQPRADKFEETAASLARDAREFGGAIRRQWRGSVLWYGRRATEILERCSIADPDA